MHLKMWSGTENVQNEEKKAKNEAMKIQLQ